MLEKRHSARLKPSSCTFIVLAAATSAAAGAASACNRCDVILELAGTAVSSAAQLQELWQKSSGTVTVLLLREERSLYVAVSH